LVADAAHAAHEKSSTEPGTSAAFAGDMLVEMKAGYATEKGTVIESDASFVEPKVTKPGEGAPDASHAHAASRVVGIGMSTEVAVEESVCRGKSIGAAGGAAMPIDQRPVPPMSVAMRAFLMTVRGGPARADFRRVMKVLAPTTSPEPTSIEAPAQEIQKAFIVPRVSLRPGLTT